MVQINTAGRELVIKLVYYGPGLSGKTTNLQALHERIDHQVRGRLLTVETADDRTLFFDLLPVFFQSRRGLKVKVKLFTVPGQVIHNATRRVVLQGADGVAFIADCRKTASEENNKYWKNMVENLLQNSIKPGDIPIVIQFNKMDLPDARSPEEVAEISKRGKEPVIPASAIRGEGVVETLHGLLSLVFKDLDARYELTRKFELSEQEFLGNIFKSVDVKGTRVEQLFQPSTGGSR